MTTVPESFGSLVFDSRVMKARLSADVYHSLNAPFKRELSSICQWPMRLLLQ